MSVVENRRNRLSLPISSQLIVVEDAEANALACEWRCESILDGGDCALFINSLLSCAFFQSCCRHCAIAPLRRGQAAAKSTTEERDGQTYPRLEILTAVV
jgi:hypothetical protein